MMPALHEETRKASYLLDFRVTRQMSLDLGHELANRSSRLEIECTTEGNEIVFLLV
jgi:hypothetical protein